MALLPHSFFPRSAFDMDSWVHPHKNKHSTLDMFDGFDELDQMMGRNMEWLRKPDFFDMKSMLPRVPQKYRITVDCPGFTASSIKTEVHGKQLKVAGIEEQQNGDDDFSKREFKKVYNLPEGAETDKLVSFMTSPGHLVIEMPLKEQHLHSNMDLFPKIIQDAAGHSKVSLDFQVPQNIHPEKVHIHVKDRDLIVKAEDHAEKKCGKFDMKSKFYFYKRTTLPDNTDFDHLKCNWENHRISVEAPLTKDGKPFQSIPFTHKNAIKN